MTKIQIEFEEGFYVAHIIGKPTMKAKTLSKLLHNLTKYYKGQGQ